MGLDEDKDPVLLQKAVVGLGCLGVVTQISLKVQPSFQVCQRVFDGLCLDTLTQERLDRILGCGYSVSLFTTWQSAETGTAPDDVDFQFQVWVKQRPDQESAEGKDLTNIANGPLTGCAECLTQQHVLKGLDPCACTDQGTPGPWHERLPHFRFDFTPSHGDELQAEYFIPRARGMEGLQALRSVASIFAPFLIICEVRTMAADNLLLSPHNASYAGPDGSVAFHFTLKKEQAAVMSVALPAIEEALQPLGARPHWGKLFTMPLTRIEEMYGQALLDFRSLAKKYDPEGKFNNDWAHDTIGL